MLLRFGLSVCLSLVLLGASTVAVAAPQVTFEQSAVEIDAFDFVEVTVKVAEPTAKNPFRDVAVTGQFQQESGSPIKVEGFCDSPDGSLYRIRFMPTKPGKYSYTVECRQGNEQQTHSGKFTARDGKAPRASADRQGASVALRLGRDGRALLLERDDDLLAPWLAGREDHRAGHRPPRSAPSKPDSGGPLRTDDGR